MKCHVDTTLASAEERELGEQERRDLSVDCRTEAIDLKPVLNVYMFSPLRRTFQVLIGGRCDEASLRLQNCGSVARDHLALERTFLAYMRTSLAIASAGVGKRPESSVLSNNNTDRLLSVVYLALVQLFDTSNKTDIKKSAHPLGASLIAMGLLVLGIGEKWSQVGRDSNRRLLTML